MSRPLAVSTPIQKPRDDKDTFTGLSRVLTNSPAFMACSAAELRVYLAIAMRHDGKNNGAIVLGSREAADECKLSRPTVMKCMHRLEARGLVVRRVMGAVPITEEGVALMAEKMASEWEVTDYWTWDAPKEDPTRRPIRATRIYADWNPQAGEVDSDGEPVGAIVPGFRPKDLPTPGLPTPSKATAAKPKKAHGPKPDPAAPKPPKPKLTQAQKDAAVKAHMEEQEKAWAAKLKPPTQDVSGQWWHGGVKLRPEDVQHFKDHPDDVAF